MTFVLKYRDYFYNQSNGILYESFGVDEQLYTYDIKRHKRTNMVYRIQIPSSRPKFTNILCTNNNTSTNSILNIPIYMGP